MRRSVIPANMLVRLASAVISLALFSGACGAMLAQKIRITSPADGVLVHSGEVLTVTVSADPSAFQSVGVGLPTKTGTLMELSAPPYVFKIPTAPDESSGPRLLTAYGIPTSGGGRVQSAITIDVERADTPQQLVAELSSIEFQYVGAYLTLSVFGVFADGSNVVLDNSTYIAYSSDTPTVAKVDEQGTVTAVAPGKAKIGITYRNVFIQVSAYVPVPITVNPSTISLHPLETSRFSATLFMDPSLDQSVKWSVNPSIGSIDQAGLYAAPSSVSARESVTVTATSVGDPTKSASAQVWVRPRQNK